VTFSGARASAGVRDGVSVQFYGGTVYAPVGLSWLTGRRGGIKCRSRWGLIGLPY